MPLEITPLILTFNEAPNIRRTLEKLSWAKEILVVDSFSADETLEMVRSFPNTRIVQRAFDAHAAQWNHGLEQCGSEWVLALDADYVLSADLVDELRRFEPHSGIAAYFARFRYCVYGRPLRGTLYPPRAVLFRRDQCRYDQDGHTQRLRVDGRTGWLSGFIDHDDRKPLSHWLWAQDRYAALEVEKLLQSTATELPIQDRLRRLIFLSPGLVFLYALLGKGLIFDGWPGWYYAFQRTLAEIILSLRLLEEKLKR